MSETQFVLSRNLIISSTLLFHFLILNLANYQVVVVSAHLPVASDEQYIVHFLSTTETQHILLQKCCLPSEVLNKDGHCAPSTSDFPQPMVPLSLEKRFKRAIQNISAYEVDNETLGDNLDENAFVLRFKFERPSCGKGFLRQISYKNSGEIQFTTSLQFVIPKFLSNAGSSSGYHSLIVNTNNYCIDNREFEESIVVLFCAPNNVDEFSPPPAAVTKVSRNQSQGNYVTSTSFSGLSSTSSSSPVLLRKCCQPSHVMDMHTFSCVRHDIPWQLYPMHSTEKIIPPDDETTSYQPDTASTAIPVESSENDGNSIPLQVSWLTGIPNCDQGFYEVYTDRYDRYYVNSEGVLITEQNGTVAKTPHTEFCIDAVIYSQQNDSDEEWGQSNNNNDTTTMMDSIFSTQIALVCFENNMEAEGLLDKGSERKFSRRTLYAIFTGISSVFLLVTCLVYTVLRKELKLPGWLQFAYSVALLLTFSLLTVAQLWTQAIHDISKSLCRALGYGLHFSFLVCFFYLTSMNFEIFSSFRSITLAHGFGKVRGKRRFLEFTAFSIGFPLAVTALLLAVDSCDPGDTNRQGSWCILPTTGIGVESCVFDSRHKVAQLHYFYGFVGILLMINLVIFVCTLVSLRNRERETRMAKRQSTSACDYDRLQLFTRLFLIMGILWIFEVISWLFQYFGFDERVQDIFIVTDCLNASQGFAVFLMFVCKRQTWKQLKKKFKTSCGIRSNRPLCRPNYNGTISSSNNTNGTSVKSSHLSSTKSRDSTRLASTSISISIATTAIGTAENSSEPLKSET